MVDLRQEDVDMLLKFEEDKPVAGNDDEEPEEQGREHIKQGEDYLNEYILTLYWHVLRQLRQTAPHYYLDDYQDSTEDQACDSQSANRRNGLVRAHLILWPECQLGQGVLCDHSLGSLAILNNK